MPGTSRPDLKGCDATAIPIAFDGCFGIFHPSTGATGAILCGAWGYEDLVIRYSWRAFAGAMADAGFPCIRFDYPASGDSLGDPSEVRLADWVSATRRACDLLLQCGVQDIVLVGHSVGALVAYAAAIDQARVAGLVLLAPTTGRRYVRETAYWAAMIAGAEGFARPAGELSIAGFAFPPRLQAELKARPENALTRAPAPWALLVESPERVDTSFGDRLAALGVEIQRQPFEGIDRLLTDPTTSKTPWTTFNAIIATLKARFAHRELGSPAQQIAAIFPPRLSTAAFAEEALNFGANGGLFGILCTPTGAQSRQAVLFLNTGRNPHTGWRRMSVAHARGLAEAGIASLRFDIAGVGESPARADRSQRVLYSEAEIEDVAAAVDLLTLRGFRSIVVVGICSGAHLGLVSAVEDARVRGLVAINLPRFAWGAKESIEAAIAYTNRTADLKVKRLFRPGTLALILRGKLDPWPAALFRIKAIARRWSLKAAPFLGRLSPGWPVYAAADARLQRLRERNTRVFLGYSGADPGYRELQLLFGPNGRRLRSHTNLTIGLVDGADHNLSQDHACDWLLERIKACVANV